MSTIFVLSSQSFADPNIASSAASADCDNATLTTYTGPTNLTADWNANTINLHWYNNNTLIENVPNVSSSCEYDSTLTPPATIPTRTGYTFTGWRVRPQYNFATLPTNQTGTERWGHGYYNNNGYCWHKVGDGDMVTTKCSDSMFNDLNIHEWKTKFNWGMIYGSAYCSAKSGNNSDDTYNNASSNWRTTYSQLESATGTKRYCWCQATGYKPDGSNTLYGPTSVSSGSVLVYAYDYSVGSNCSQRCARGCANYIRSRYNFQKALFGVM